MLPKAHRLPLRGSRSFFQTARSVHTRKLSLFWNPNSTASSKATISVKKSAAPLSTQRSLIKRRLRALVLSHLSAPTSIHRDIFLVYKGKPNPTYQELAADVEKIFAMVRD
jgi:ribonuclease P protein component